MKIRLITIAVLAALSFSAAGVSSAASVFSLQADVESQAVQNTSGELSWYRPPFPWDNSDVAPDPAITYGYLSNGLRYAVYPHQMPKGRVSVYLDVQAGSLFETPEQLGFAHYIEHMAFNGTRNYPAGSLIPFFQQNGMSFGGDTNAFTSSDTTVYQLNLAATDPAQLEKGLSVLRDYADGQLFEEKEVKDEMGIILSEKRARDSEANQARDAFRRWYYAGTKFADSTIGEERTIKSASSERLRAFYSKWYRPDRMVVIVSGDVKPLEVVPMIDRAFSSMKAPDASSPGNVISSFGQPKAEGVRAWASHRKESSTAVTVRIMHPRTHAAPSKAENEKTAAETLVSLMMQRRLQVIQEKQPKLWQKAYFYSEMRGTLLPQTAFYVTTSNSGWQKALASLHDEIASAVKFGFTESEVKLAADQFEDSLEDAAQNFNALPNDEIALSIAMSVNSDLVMTSPEQDLKFFRAIRNRMTRDRLNETVRKLFSPENRTIEVSGGAVCTDKQILKVWNDAEKRPVTQESVPGNAVFPYLALPPAPSDGALASVRATEQMKTLDSSLGIKRETYTLPNGFKVVLMPLPMEKGTVNATLYFGLGAKSYPDSESWMPKLASAVIAEHGVGRLTQSETDATLGAKNVAVGESYKKEKTEIAGSAKPADLVLMLQGIWTQYKDPTVTEADLERVRASAAQTAHKLYETPMGASLWMPTAYFTGNLNRMKPLPPEQEPIYTLEAAKRVIAESRIPSAMTLTVTGDFDRNTALRTALQLFGEFELGTHESLRTDSPLVLPEGQSERVTLKGTAPKAILNEAWKTEPVSGADRKTIMENHLAAAVLSDRLRSDIREKLGVSYSPRAGFTRLDGEQGFSFIRASVQTSPKELPLVKETLASVTSDLAKNGIKADEFERIRKPLVTQLKTGREENETWELLLSREIREGKPWTEWYGESLPALNAVTPEDLGTVFKKTFSEKPAVHEIVTE